MVNQTEFWDAVRKHRKKPAPRVVPAFTIQALQDNTVVAKPPRPRDLYKERPPRGGLFRHYYERGAFPVTLEMTAGVTHLNWKAPVDQLDYHFYLPLFFHGLCEPGPPYPALAEAAINEMLDAAAGCSSKILPALPMIIRPVKEAIDTKIPRIMCRALRVLQRLVRSGDCIGETLVPYFRQLLPTLNLFIHRCSSVEGGIDYAQQKGENISDAIQETLELMEQYGGEDAFINIKYIIPTYESCVKN
ncbi:hypothetical protein QAD02_006544 [Eretmocerus hayati]|uniref:Uncharacterized protein n=1 Tax=Eretmocerus hayati TaxID=131215 RepID=A0ACC2N1I6_9HYME|nr:hypothetical protein QAD02_006544 [Eretmocerus hayati]